MGRARSLQRLCRHQSQGAQDEAQRSAARVKIEPGSIWRDNDKRVKRLVRVFGVSFGWVEIQTCDEQGNTRGRKTQTSNFRFEASFSFVCPVAPSPAA